MPAGPIQVEGLGELNGALRDISRSIKTELRKELRLAGQPVARTAERLAMENISGMSRYRTVNWSKMRVGAAGGNAAIVYIAPKQRGRKRGRQRRPNLVNLMLKKSMEPALRRQRPVVVRAVEQAVNRAIRRAGF